ncbi:MAG: hypothetical protein K5637_08185 [Lachnospiraceae bacterium]|nr:hypothetical protein [Lachnospiraceae bacterium]
MNKIRKILITVLLYIGIFAAAVIISDLVKNGGMGTASADVTESTLPVVYVKSGGKRINAMYGFVNPVDAGYFHDTMTPVGSSLTVNLVVDSTENAVEGMSYELYNDSFDALIESGDCETPEKSDKGWNTRLVFRNELYSNREYCLRIILDDGTGRNINYYTRVHYGESLYVSEKLKFVTDFNEATFDKDSDDISRYLETRSSSGSSGSDYSLVTIESTFDAVTWGKLDPVRISDLNIVMKEINTETGVFTLSYSVEVGSGSTAAQYIISEYYRIKYIDDQMYLWDFRRQMFALPDTQTASFSDGYMSLGIGDSDKLSMVRFGDGDRSMCAVTDGNWLWLYDATNQIVTSVYDSSNTRFCSEPGDMTRLKVISTDPKTGDICFMVYGYIGSGRHEGSEGILLYRFDHESVAVYQIAYIPYTASLVQLDEGVGDLACMDGNGNLYLKLDGNIYRFGIDSGDFEQVFEEYSGRSYASSNEGYVAFSEGGEEDLPGGGSIVTVDLSSGDKKTVDGGGMQLVPLGYIGDVLIYGVLDPAQADAYDPQTGLMKMTEIHLAGTDLSDLKVYSRDAYYIKGITVSGGSITISMIKRSEALAGDEEYADYIIYNSSAQDEDTISLASISRGSSGTVNAIRVGSSTFVPITQTARTMSEGYGITREYTQQSERAQVYYVYAYGHMERSFSSLADAVDFAHDTAGIVMSGSKKVLWQCDGRAYIWSLDMEDYISAEEAGGKTLGLVKNICAYEGWKVPEDITVSGVYDTLSSALPVSVMDLTGMELDDVLHFVYRDRIVAARTGSGAYCMIIGYDTLYIYTVDIESGQRQDYSWSSAEELFEKAGNVFYSYID